MIRKDIRYVGVQEIDYARVIVTTMIMALVFLNTFNIMVQGFVIIPKKEAGEELLNAMYDFEVENMYENDDKFKSLTTIGVYEGYTVTSSNRQLRVYMKFGGEPVKPKILKHEDGRIYFNLINKHIDSDRIFVIEYEFRKGEISHLAEYEIHLLPQTIKEDLF